LKELVCELLANRPKKTRKKVQSMAITLQTQKFYKHIPFKGHTIQLPYQAHLCPHYVLKDYPIDRSPQMQRGCEVEAIYSTTNTYKDVLH
jgi:hypothetical protein